SGRARHRCDRRLHPLAGGAGTLEDRAVGGRHRELRLVPGERAAGSLHVGAGSDADGARACAFARGPGARRREEPRPAAAGGALLYNIFNTRTEGFATEMEGRMMQVGLCDARPRSRELVYILIAQRAARALGDLRMHANQLTLEQAAKFAAGQTPRGWLRLS